jgi:CMP-N,N'-diacetyllegionaminic acid synthase
MWAIIPARGGSKGIPRKNVKIFRGKPLIVHTIEQAQQSTPIERVIVSTDDEEIAQIARAAGAEVPFMRPAPIAQDMSTDLEFMQHATEWFQTHENRLPVAWVHLRPTYPLRKVGDLEKACQSFSEGMPDSLRSVVPTEHSVFKSYTVSDGTLIPIFKTLNSIKEPFNMPRQMLPTSYQHNGCIDIVAVQTIQSGSMSGTNIKAFVMDATETHDLDTIEQWDRTNDYKKKVSLI